MQNHLISEIDAHKYLGLYFTNDCTWHYHINYITEKAWHRLNIMRKLKFKLDRKSLETIYLTFIRPLLEYGDVIFDNCTLYEKQELDKIQNEAARIATGTTKLVSLAIYTMKYVGKHSYNHKLTLFYKMMHNITPLYLSSLGPQSVVIYHATTFETQTIYKLLMLELISTIILFCRQVLEHGTIYLLKQSNVNL